MFVNRGLGPLAFSVDAPRLIPRARGPPMLRRLPEARRGRDRKDKAPATQRECLLASVDPQSDEFAAGLGGKERQCHELP
jgi:hypothetical protein